MQTVVVLLLTVCRNVDLYAVAMAPTEADYTQKYQRTWLTTVISGITYDKDSTTISTFNNNSSDDSSSLLSFYFKIAVIILGVVGTVANGTALWILIFAKQVMKFSVITIVEVFIAGLLFVFG
jgi:hypothetical protein